MYDSIIVGAGPAGLSAALYLLRGNKQVLILEHGQSNLEKAEKIENYFGLEQPISGKVLLEIGRRQAQRLGAKILAEQVTSLGFGEGFEITTGQNTYQAKTVLLATGVMRKSPALPGIEALTGKGVSSCAVCDGFFFRGKQVAVLGAGEYALHEAEVLLPLAGSVTLFTNGQTPPDNLPQGLAVNTAAVIAVNGENKLQSVSTAEGILPMDGLFLALGTASASDLAVKLGAATENGKILVDDKMATNLPGLYAAGDCTGGVLQIATAVGEGATAGLAMLSALRSLS